MNRFYAWLGSVILRAIVNSLRLKVDDRAAVLGRRDRQPVIFAFWHNRIALMAVFCERYCRGREVFALISRSRDGELITEVAGRFNIKAARGSSSRHGTAAALAAVHAARNFRSDLAITPDGPRGPRYQMQPGLVRLAQATGHPIVPMSCQLQWKWSLKSWDRFQVPIPFSFCLLIAQELIYVPKEATEADRTAISARVAEALGGD